MAHRNADISFEVANLDVRLGGRLVLRNVSFAARHGEFICVVGRSGCGKTSLLRTLGGLVPPSGGTLSMPTSGRGVRDGGADCAMVFQADSLFPWMTVLKNATFGLRSRGMPEREANAKAREWLRKVGLPAEVDQQKPRQLSGGMRQRVNLVRALALEPLVILMDEPFASLDYQTREELQAELIRLSSRHAMTTVFVTHDVPEAVFLADRIVVMHEARQGISEVFDVAWGEERDIGLKSTSAFADLCGQVSRAVRSEQ